MAEGRVVRAVENRSGGLVENRSGGLLHVTGFLILGVGVDFAGRQTADVQPFGSAGLIAGEVVAREQNGMEDGMIDVDAGINHGDDASAADAETVLGVLQADNLGSGLSGIAMPDDRAVVIHRSMVIEA